MVCLVLSSLDGANETSNLIPRQLVSYDLLLDQLVRTHTYVSWCNKEIDFCDLEMDHDLPVPVNSPHVPNTPTIKEVSALFTDLNRYSLINLFGNYNLTIWIY